jgi:predicted secreted Zn-dependent protease
MLRRLALQMIAVSAITAFAPAMAQTSAKPITMLVPFAAGGNSGKQSLFKTVRVAVARSPLLRLHARSQTAALS